MLEINWKFKPFMYFIDILGYLFVKPFLRKTLPDIKKILVIRVDEVGDAILTTPVFKALKQKFPMAEVCALIKSLTKAVYENNSDIDRIITTQSWLKSWSGQRISLFQFFKLIKQLRKEDFDLVVELHTDPRNILLASLTGKYCIGYAYRGFGFLLNKKAQKIGHHIIKQGLDVVKLVGAEASETLVLDISQKATESIREKLQSLGLNLSKTKKLVCINPGAGRTNKLWFANSWSKLIFNLLEKKNVYIILTGTQSELSIVDDIIASLPKGSKRVLNLCAQTALPELFALVNHCNLVIAPDSAVIHIANALEVPSLGIYGPTNPVIWGYNTSFNKSIFRKLDCSFCNQAVCKFEANRHKCMEWISSKDVFREVETFI